MIVDFPEGNQMLEMGLWYVPDGLFFQIFTVRVQALFCRSLFSVTVIQTCQNRQVQIQKNPVTVLI